MTTYSFEIPDQRLTELLTQYPNLGKNSHVGNIAVKVVQLYFLSRDPAASFEIAKGGADLIVTHNGKQKQFEIKGTVSAEICWQKLKVSSKNCYNALVNGMTLIRVTNIGQPHMQLHFLKYGEDFNLVPEDRWAVKPLKKKDRINNKTITLGNT